MDPFEFAVEATIFELNDDPTLRKRVRSKDLRSTAWSRLKGAGFLQECSRCAGKGYCGPFSVYGGACFKCGGSKYSIPKFTQKWRNDVLAYDWRQYMDNLRKNKSGA